MAESTQHKLDRVRPPRVQITYDVETGDAIEKKELPFLMGIMADLSGKPEEPLAKLRDRRFVEIDRDNFNDVMKSCTPRIAVAVDNKLTDADDMLHVALSFDNIEDFDPVNVLKQIPTLAGLYEARQRLSDLLTKLDGNDALDSLLQDVIENSVGQEEIKKALEPGDAPEQKAAAGQPAAKGEKSDDGGGTGKGGADDKPKGKAKS